MIFAGYELLIANLELYEGTKIPDPTPVPAATPEPTAEPTPEPTAEPTPEPKGSGCETAFASSCAVLMVSLPGAAWVLKKKH